MDKNRIKFILVVSVLAVIAASSLNARPATASVFDNFWKDKITPFLEKLQKPFAKDRSVTTSTEAQKSGEDQEEKKTEKEKEKEVPLYKPVIEYEQAIVSAVKKASPAVVSIVISKNLPIYENCAINPFYSLPPEFQQFFGDIPQIQGQCQSGKTKLQEVGGGSGFVVSEDGLIVTNKHVVLDKDASYTVITNDGKKYDAKVLARDPAQDIAVVKISATGLPAVELGDSNSIELGQTAIAIGNALSEFRNTVSVGVISGLARTIDAGGAGFSETLQGVIQTDAAINPGNSGGPLLNLKGQVIGINTAVASDAENIGFAIPINRAKKDINSVKASGEIQSAYLGVRYLTVTEEIAKAQKLPVDYGALIRGTSDGPAVEPDSPAAKARLLMPDASDGGQTGLQAEDIILEINGKKINKENQLANAIGEFNVGQTVTLKINRGGKEMNLSVALEKRPEGK